MVIPSSLNPKKLYFLVFFFLLMSLASSLWRVVLQNLVRVFRLIGFLLFGLEKDSNVLDDARSGLLLVDDWDCLKSMIQIFNLELIQYSI